MIKLHSESPCILTGQKSRRMIIRTKWKQAPLLFKNFVENRVEFVRRELKHSRGNVRIWWNTRNHLLIAATSTKWDWNFLPSEFKYFSFHGASPCARNYFQRCRSWNHTTSERNGTLLLLLKITRTYQENGVGGSARVLYFQSINARKKFQVFNLGKQK